MVDLPSSRRSPSSRTTLPMTAPMETRPPALYVVGNSGVCLLVVHVCRTVDRVVGHTRPSLAGIGVPWVSFMGPTDVS